MRTTLLLLAAAVLALAAPGAYAAPGPPALDQYVEMIPTAEGDAQAGQTGDGKPLPPEVRARISARGGADAQALTEIATSPSLGAPPSATPTAPSVAGPAGGGESDGESPAEDAEAVEESVGPLDAVTSSSSADSRIVALLVFMGVSLVAALALEAVRRRRPG